MNTKEKIKNYLKAKGKTTGKELADFLNITDRAVRKQLVNNGVRSDLLLL